MSKQGKLYAEGLQLEIIYLTDRLEKRIESSNDDILKDLYLELKEAREQESALLKKLIYEMCALKFKVSDNQGNDRLIASEVNEEILSS